MSDLMSEQMQRVMDATLSTDGIRLRDGLPRAPPPPALVELALSVGKRRGLQVEFLTRVANGVGLVWCVQITTARGDLVRWPKDLTEDAWWDCLTELGLTRP